MHNIESYAEALNIMILSKSGIHEPDFQKIKQSLHDLSKTKILGKVKIEYCDVNKNGKAIVIGEGFIKDFVNDREIDIFYPCWLFVDINAENVSFKSTFPENRDHHYLLEDLSTEIYNQILQSTHQ